MTFPILDIRHLGHQFGTQHALRNISFSVQKGEFVGLIGRSGAGKSTLLRCLCALEKPTHGQVILDGLDLTRQSEARLVEIRRKIGLVFQHFNLLTSRNVAGNIALPLQIAGWPRQKQAARISELLELVGLAGFEGKYPSKLSGGQKQRVGIARALAASPALLLCDEATSALDPEATTSILNLLGEINRKLNLTIILITHEMDVVRRFARRIIVLDHGHLIEDGTLIDFLHDSDRQQILATLLADIRPQLPASLHQILRPDGGPDDMCVLRCVIDQEAARKPLFSEISQRFGVETILLQGGVTTLRDTIFGDMIIGLSGERSKEAEAFLADLVQTMEVLGYVPANH